MTKLRAEIWTRPGDPAYGRRILGVPFQNMSGTQGYNGVYGATLDIPKVYNRLDDIFLTDGVTPSNGVASTLKVFSEGTTDPIYESIISDRIPAQGKNDPTVKFSGDSLEVIPGWARVEPWDWNGSTNWVSKFPDWIYGGRNLLSNPGFEDSVCRPEVDTVTLDAAVAGGTFTLSFGANTTDPIAWNATAFQVETALEDVGNGPVLDDALVTGSGTVDDPWVIEAVDPCEVAGGLIADFTSLTPAPGDSELARTQFGALQPNPWTKSQVISSGTPRIFGEYDSFRVTTAQAHSGTFSLLIDPAPIGRRFAGAQQVLNVEADGTYQASVWVYTASASQEYRLVIRGIDEDILSTATGLAITQVTPAANTWTQLSIPDVLTEENTQIIFRIANINISGNPAIFYVDDGEFNEGMPATTVGCMWLDLYAAWIDPALRSPIMWDDGSATDTPYLTPDFDCTYDSAGVPWDRSDVSLTFRPRMTGHHVLGAIVNEGGYEWRVIADTVPGYYVLQLFNPGGLGATVAAKILGGSRDTSSNARFFMPFTHLMTQGSAQVSSRAQNAGLISAFGRIESSNLDLSITSTASAAASAAEGVASQVRGAESLVYNLVEPTQEPLVIYKAGDIIAVGDPPIVEGSRRVSEIEFTVSSDGVEYSVKLGSGSLTGQSAVNHEVGVLMRRFQRADEMPQEAAVQVLGGGGMMTVAVAAVNASGMSQGKADFICSGSADHTQIMEAMEICYAAGGGEVWLSEGRFEISGDKVIVGFSIAYPEPIVLRGMGYGTTISFDGFTNFAVFVAQDCALKECNVFLAGVG